MQKFIIKSPNGHLLEHIMRSDMITMGRDPSNDIVLNASSVSRRHARIYIWENKYCIEDLGSSNGVYVNGHRINEAVAIDPSCRIDVGGFELTFGASPAGATSGGASMSQLSAQHNMQMQAQAQQRPSTAAPANYGLSRLVGLSEPLRDQVFGLPASGEVTVGRADNNTITIHHNSISRNHARIIVGGGQVVVQDMGSSNGTYVNGHRVSGKLAAPPGAEIRIGHVTFRLDDPNVPKSSRQIPYSGSHSGVGQPEKLTQRELIKYAIVFLVLIIFMLSLTIVLVKMLDTGPKKTNAPIMPPAAAAPANGDPNK